MAHTNIKEFLSLIALNFKVLLKNIIEYTLVVFLYYRKYNFFKIDSSLLLSYLFQNPYRISKHFLVEKGAADVYVYGETPLTTLEKISQQCQLANRDVIFELGCGRGRTCFWLSQFIQCKVVGIEHIPVFIQKAEKIKQRFQVNNVQFQLGDLFTANLKGATVIYLYGTCFSSEEIKKLIRLFSKLPNGTKVITVSYALTDYQPKAPFQILYSFPAAFTWGTADVYLQIKQSPNY